MSNKNAVSVTASGETPTVPLVQALDGLLQDIKYHHPDLPPIMLVVGASGVSKRRQIHGHFAPKSWAGDVERHEILLSGESLQRGAEATLGTLLHESAHAIAHARGVQDTSNNGRYHNKRFKKIGEEVGIDLENGGTLGWSLTTVPKTTIERYEDGVKSLKDALVAYRVSRVEKSEPKVRNKTKISIDCGCFKPVTVSKKWFEEATMRLKCDDCLESFHEVDENGEV